MNIALILLAASICFGINLFIETTSWCIRSKSNSNSQGLFNSRANIYLFSARFFNLVFMTLMALLVDLGSATSKIVFITATAITLAALIHFLYQKSFFVRDLTNNITLRLLFLDKKVEDKTSKILEANKHLQLWTIFSVIFLIFGVTLPFIVASIFPDNRMMISSLGQIINAFGTLITLFKVDSLMYKKMDSGNLDTLVDSYVTGRYIGLLVSAAMAWLLLYTLNFM